MGESIRVLLADDHPLVRAGLRAALGLDPDLRVVGEAATGDEARRLCRELRPDVLLLDLRMPGPPAAAVVAAVADDCPETQVMILTAYNEAAYVRGLVANGIAGYVLKDEPPEALLLALRTVARGGSWFSRPIAAQLARSSADVVALPHLTDRERELLPLLAQGETTGAMAAALNVTDQTVRNYLSQLYTKLGVRSRAEAAVWVRDHGLA